MQLPSTAKQLIKLTSDPRIQPLRGTDLCYALPSREGFLLTTDQTTRSSTDQGAGTAFLARYGEQEWSDSVEILQGSRRFGLEQYVPYRGIGCPIDPYRADLLSHARPAADPRFCDGLAGQRHWLPPLEPTDIKTTNQPQNRNSSRHYQTSSIILEGTTVGLMPGTTSLRSFSAASD